MFFSLHVRVHPYEGVDSLTTGFLITGDSTQNRLFDPLLRERLFILRWAVIQ